jgi:hypothetical protein
MKIISFIEDEQLVKKTSTTWTYGMSNPNRRRVPIARLSDPPSSMMSPYLPARMIISSMLIIRLKPTCKKSSTGQSSELRLNLAKFSIYQLKITVDNQTRFRYRLEYLFQFN